MSAYHARAPRSATERRLVLGLRTQTRIEARVRRDLHISQAPGMWGPAFPGVPCHAALDFGVPPKPPMVETASIAVSSVTLNSCVSCQPAPRLRPQVVEGSRRRRPCAAIPPLWRAPPGPFRRCSEPSRLRRGRSRTWRSRPAKQCARGAWAKKFPEGGTRW